LRNTLPIDAVVMWVDGDDPAHQAKLEAYLASIGRVRPHAAAPTRFRSVGEIDYCLRSLLRFAPFLRRIHVLTDSQSPPIFERRDRWSAALRDKLVLVDHVQAFAGFEDCLPSFNSRAIASAMHRIPGLAEHHVCLNDDVMLLRPIGPEAWFRDGAPVLRGRFAAPPHRKLGRRLRTWLRRWVPGASVPSPTARAGLNDAQALAGRMAGFVDRYFALDHAPFALRRSTLERYFTAHPDALRRNVAHRLRHSEQFEPVALSCHLELSAGTAVIEPNHQLLYVKPTRLGHATLRRRLERDGADPNLLFACIQSLDEADEGRQRIVLEWLSRQIGDDDPF
jgi:hypothetical protein